MTTEKTYEELIKLASEYRDLAQYHAITAGQMFLDAYKVEDIAKEKLKASNENISEN